MKNITILFIIMVSFLSSCEDQEKKSDQRKLTDEKISGTWLIVGEMRLSDSWTQSNEDGIITDWKIENPFGGEMTVSSVKFYKDQTYPGFFWNTEEWTDWESFISMWKDIPKELWNNYQLGKDGNSITLYTRFEYVGIIKVVTTEFRSYMIQDDQLILENNRVRLRLSKKDGPY